MKHIFNNKIFYYFCLFFFSLFSAELIFRIITKASVFSVAIIRIFIGIVVISLLLSLFINIFNKTISNIISLIVLFLLSTYICMQLGFLNFLGVYISINASTQLGAVMDYVKDFILSFKWYYFLVYLPFIISFIYVIKRKKVYPKNEGAILLGVIITLLFSIFYYCTFSISFMKINNKNAKEYFLNPSIPTINVENFGILGFGVSDIRAVIFGIKENTDINYTDIEINKPENNEIDTKRDFDDTKWKNIIETETNETLNTINNYLINNTSTNKNEYTGLFKNKNLIVIMMESVNDIINNPTYYPNFNKILNNGLYFENNYSPRNTCPTGNNEFSGMTGLYSIYNSCTANVYKNNTYYESLFNLFNDAGYSTISMHDYTEAYYTRSIIHSNMGSNKYYGVDDLDIRYSDLYVEWASDAEFAESAMDIIINEYSSNPFMLWMTTVSGHQPYTVNSTEGDLYFDLFKDTTYPNNLKRYMSKIKVTDDGLGIILEKLENAGILNDTVIVLYGDHYPYGLSNETLSNVIETSLEEDYEVDRVPFVIYSPSVTKQTISTYTTYMNITPTIANLFDLNFDPRLYFGKDLFSDESNLLAVFADGSWKNEIAYYNASNGKITYYTQITYTEEEINNINSRISNDIKVSALIIKNNYFKYLNEALNAVN